MEETKEIDQEMQQDDVVSIELPAPSGWIKKYTPKKGGITRRNAIFFISPTGEEIKSKRHLDQYLKAHPGGPSASKFDWGTGDTPRRSARLTGKSKASESPESETPKKKQRKSSAKKEAEDKRDTEEGDAAKAKEVTAEESEGSQEVEMEDGENATNEVQDKNNGDDAEKKPEGGEIVTDMPLGNEEIVGAKERTGENNDELNVDEKAGENIGELKLGEETGENNDELNVDEKAGENIGELKLEEETGENKDGPPVTKNDTQEAENKPSDVKEENAETKSLPASAGKESDEVRSETLKPESESDLPLQNEVASSGPEPKTLNDAANSIAEDRHVGDSPNAKVGQPEHPLKDSGEAAPVGDNLKTSQEANDQLKDPAVPAGYQGAST